MQIVFVLIQKDAETKVQTDEWAPNENTHSKVSNVRCNAKTPWSWGRTYDVLSEGCEIETRRQLENWPSHYYLCKIGVIFTEV